jgi:purine-binding chemotaxis protein CheW
MGRMADARKRARRAAAEPAAEGEPRLEPQPQQPAPPASEPVFADEPAEAGEAVPAATSGGSGVVLPASGLAEDILARLEGAPRDALPSDGAMALPASGLAEEVLGREQTLSFFSAPAQQQRAAAEATEHLATFFLAKEEYGVDVKQVQEIRRVAEITSVPRAPEFVRGVINLRGRILPVLDLRRRLALGEVVVDRDSRIVVVRVKDRLLGLLVDGASQVLKVPVSQIEAAPEEVVQKGGDYIRGVAKLADRLIILVDLERLLATELAAAGVAATGARAAEVHDGVSQE